MKRLNLSGCCVIGGVRNTLECMRNVLVVSLQREVIVRLASIDSLYKTLLTAYCQEAWNISEVLVSQGSPLRRADRLFRIVEYLKARREAVTALELGEELGVGVRTIYRDIADLKASGVPLTGEAGVGYLLSPHFVVRPLLFGDEELEALALGAQMVQSWADPAMAQAARKALDKITAVLPDSLADNIRQATSFAHPSSGKQPIQINFTSLRRAIRTQHIVEILYTDQSGSETTRQLRPLALVFLAPIWLLLGWCELRQSFRSFRVDRMQSMRVLNMQFDQEKGKTLADMQKQCEQELINQKREGQNC